MVQILKDGKISPAMWPCRYCNPVQYHEFKRRAEDAAPFDSFERRDRLNDRMWEEGK
jgi:hypothetical protein